MKNREVFDSWQGSKGISCRIAVVDRDATKSMRDDLEAVLSERGFETNDYEVYEYEEIGSRLRLTDEALAELERWDEVAIATETEDGDEIIFTWDGRKWEK